MDRLLIRRCTLRLHRKGGWSWGPEPDRLVRAATRALPELISRKLAPLLVDQGRATIGRLEIRVPVTLSELIEIGQQPADKISSSSFSHRVALRCQQALALQTPALPAVDDSPAVQPADLPSADSSESHAAQKATNDILTLLVEWYEQGKLIRLLRDFSERSLAAWEKLALDALSPVAHADDLEGEWLGATEILSRKICDASAAPTSSGSRRLILLAALLQQFPQQIPRGKMLSLLDQYMVVDDLPPQSTITHQETEPSPETDVHTNRIVRDDSRDADDDVSHACRTKTKDWLEVKLTSVLPFVAVGVLSRLKYFDVVSTALRADGCAADLRSFVVALSYKMLPIPNRGWHRDEADRRTAAAVAGLLESEIGEKINRCAEHCADGLSPADGFLQLLLAEGHDPSRAVLIHRLQLAGRPLWVLLDSQGCFVIGWFLSQEALMQAVDDFAGSMLLVSEPAAEPSLLALLARKHRFVTSASPVRGDRWRPVDRRRLLWTNDWDSSTESLLRDSECFQFAVESAERVTRALMLDRPVLPAIGSLQPSTVAQQRRQDGLIRFERSLAFAAASALGVISWQLWGQQESTDPLLAIERLGDLDGRVSIGREPIIVRPALGRRYQDLYRHNFLVDVPNLPWLGGRRLEFAGL